MPPTPKMDEPMARPMPAEFEDETVENTASPNEYHVKKPANMYACS